MKTRILLTLAVVLFVNACHKVRHSDGVPSPSSSNAMPAGHADLANGEVVCKAAIDHSLPPYIRNSAEVFQWIIEGREWDEKKIDESIRELSYQRNERTCAIWISMLRSCVSGLPSQLPPLEDYAKLEKQGKKSTPQGLESNPMRFLGMLTWCVKILAEYDMPEADIQVDAFLARFEQKYASSDLGKHFLDSYQMEIRQAKEGRKNGGSAWQRGRKSYGKGTEF